MHSYLLIGPGIVAPTLSSENDRFQTYGNGLRKISCRDVELPEHAHVRIDAHGFTYMGKHYISLCEDTEKNSHHFSDDIQVLSRGKIVYLELSSCFGGAAVYDISYLPVGSTLITFTSEIDTILGSVADEVFVQSIKFEHQDNPFIKFVSYIFVNPHSTRFALHSEAGKKIFSAEIKTLEHFTSAEILKWQKMQFDQFLKFCQTIQNNVSKKSAEQITELLNLFEDDHYLNKWLSDFDVKRYQELLLISQANIGDQNLVDKLLKESSVDVNCKTLRSSSSLYFASWCGNSEVIELLLAAGAKINDRNHYGYSPLLGAVLNGHSEAVKLLLAAGANVNHKNDYGFSLLGTACAAAKSAMVHILLSNGANTEEAMSCVDHKSADIREMIHSYDRDPIQYILQNNQMASFALRAMKNLEFQSHLANLFPMIEKIESCLETQPDGLIKNLVGICVEHSL